jgi:rod shape determining protein RodA
MKLTPSYLIKRFDWVSFVTMLIMAGVSLIMLYSIALGSDDATDLLNFKKQIVFVLLGVVVYLVVAFYVDYRLLKNTALFWYVGALGVLIAVLLFGTTIRGTTGWFSFAGFSLQPVELVKIILIIFLARYLTFKAKYLHQLRYLIFSAVGVGIAAFLVLLQPDFGSAVILLGLWLGLVLITGIKKSHFIMMTSGGILSAIFLWFVVFQEYQKNRIRVFLDPALDPLGTGYNVTQAIIAVGSGQLFGRGLSFGSQSKLKFLPEAQTDFIFAVISEQLGFFGVVVIISLFGVLFWRILQTARESEDNFAMFACVGVLLVLCIQVGINISMNIGLMPVTGLTLPLLSYGGSSMLATMIMLGIVQGIGMRSRT